MPIDPRISFGVRSLEVADPLEQYARVAGVQNLLQRGQVQQQATQLNAVRLKQAEAGLREKELEAREDQEVQHAIGQTGGRPDELLKALQGKVRAKIWYGVARDINQGRQAAQALKKSELDNRLAQNQALQELMGRAVELPDDQYIAAGPAIIAEAKTINPELQISDMPDKRSLAIHRHLYRLDEGIFKEEAEKRAAAGEKQKEALRPSELRKAEQDAIIARQKAAGTEPIQPAERERIDISKKTQEATERYQRARAGVRSKNEGEKAQARLALSDVVVDNPGLYDELTPTEKGNIAPELAKRGFTGFGKKPSEAAIRQMAETRSAIDGLSDLKEVLKKNEQYIGPIAGFQALNPYSEARKAQADIDRVKQRVGKALEGGVLRKEDEEKYKKILATLRDEPSTAIYKVDQLVTTLENDLSNYVDEQRRGGRTVTERPKKPAPAGSEGADVPRATHRYNPATRKIEAIP